MVYLRRNDYGSYYNVVLTWFQRNFSIFIFRYFKNICTIYYCSYHFGQYFSYYFLSTLENALVFLLSTVLSRFHHYSDSNFFKILMFSHIFSCNIISYFLMKALIEWFSLKQLISCSIHIGLTCNDVLGKKFFFNEVQAVSCAALIIEEIFHNSLAKPEPYF